MKLSAVAALGAVLTLIAGAFASPTQAQQPVVAQMLAVVSHVPGGVGVFESAMVLLLKPFLTAGQVLPALVLYRAIYYLLPLAIALVILLVDEVRQRVGQAARARAVFGALAQEVTPRVLAIFTFLAGAVLLFSGATPAAEGRLDWLADVLPLPMIEASHFLGSVVGVVLLLISQGVARRLESRACRRFMLLAATTKRWFERLAKERRTRAVVPKTSVSLRL